MMALHPVVAKVSDRIIARSATTRAAYLNLIDRARFEGLDRPRLSCGNLAHGFAAAGEDKATIRAGNAMNIGIVTAYNDMLSAHQPYGRYPEQIKLFAREVGATAQVAGGVPAMCDGVTQGQLSMEPWHVRKRADAGHLRQDRSRSADRGLAVRSFADDPHSGGADAVGPGQQGKGAHPAIVCRGQSRARRIA
jgi:hypothetical protein